jgi:hypothetical protein
MTTATVESALELQVFDHKHLSELMKVRRMSTTELGVRCGRSAFTTKAYIENRADPPSGVAALMAFALGVEVSELFRTATDEDVELVTVTTPRRPGPKS